MENLKKCPFCGGEATPVYCENGNRYTSNILHLSKRGTIKCKKCELTLPRVYSKVLKAIKAWNNRVTEAEIRASVIDEFARRIIELNNEPPIVENDYGEIRPMRIEEMCERISKQMKGDKE